MKNADTWTIVSLLERQAKPAIKTVTREEAKQYNTGGDVVTGVDEILVIRTSAEFIEISWRVSRGGKWRLKHRVNYYRDVLED